MTKTIIISLVAVGVTVVALGALTISQVSPAGAQNQAAARAIADGEARGVVRAPTDLAIASVEPARIVDLPFGEGMRFVKGTVLVRFDCARLEAERDAARAVMDTRQVALDTQEVLLKRRAGGELDVKAARSALLQAQAELRGFEARVGTCQIAAPFDGMVGAKKAEAGMVANPGAPILEVYETGHYEVMLVVPSRWLANVRPGMPFRFAVDETGDTLRGSVTRIAPVVDPVAQTARVVGRLEDPGQRLLPGMSGSARFAAAGG